MQKIKAQIFEANPENGYNFPFILVEPLQMPKHVKLFVEGNNSHNYTKRDENGNIVGFQDFAEQLADEMYRINDYINYGDRTSFNMPFIYNNLNHPIIIPIIERCDASFSGEFYTQMLGKNVVHTTDGPFANLSSQVVSMVNAVKAKYEERGITCADKSGLLGVSASGVFASRMAFLEPESFDVCLSMSSNAIQPLPIPEYNGVSLPYPLGTADYKQITGKEFNAEEYKKIHQLFIVSKEENNRKYDIVFNHQQLHDDETAMLFSQVFGRHGIQDRQSMMAYIFAELGIDNAECVIAEGGHNIDETKRDIVLSWANEVLSNPEIYRTENSTNTNEETNNREN